MIFVDAVHKPNAKESLPQMERSKMPVHFIEGYSIAINLLPSSGKGVRFSNVIPDIMKKQYELLSHKEPVAI